MKSKEKHSSLTIETDAAGSLAVTGSVEPGDDASLAEAMEAARSAEGDVVMILTHASREAESREGLARGAGAEASLHAIANAVARALEQRESILGLIEHLSPPMGVPSPPSVLQARRNSEARRALFDEFGGLTAAEVAEFAGSTARNRSALATRWRTEGRLLAVTHQGKRYYPGFQFGEDWRPLPTVALALNSLRHEPLGEWELALWFTTRNGWLDDRRPVDLLVSEPNEVLAAARHEVDAIAG